MNIPKDKGIDHTWKVLHEGYTYILDQSERFDSNIFETKLLGEKVICLLGEQAAELFYDQEKFRRQDAAPKHVKKTLFGKGGVQGLDGANHHHRKRLFMNQMNPSSLEEVQQLMRTEWEKAAVRWEEMEEVVLYEEAKKVLTRVAFQWTGMPLQEKDVDEWATELGDMYESATRVGPKNWKARQSRSKAEEWVEELVEQVRNHQFQPPEDRALYQFSFHKDLNGNLLDKHTVAVELLNLVRPIVAISVYLDFVALALHEFPEEVKKLNSGDKEKLRAFIQEVRRYYPFFPFAAARADRDFIWNDVEFREGTLTLLDLYGTNHHPDQWTNPETFNPARFYNWEASPFDFIPQGGGEFDIGHRCAGEWMTIDLLTTSLHYFVQNIRYDMPEQNLNYSMNDIPSLPKSRIKWTNVHRV